MHKYLVALLILISGNACALASKWVDEQGNVHYSDARPPATAKSRQLVDLPEPAAPAPVAAAPGAKPADKPAGGKPAADDPAGKKAAAEKAQQEAEVKALNKANCAGAKQNLANLQDGMRIAVIDPATGERSYLDDDQRAKNVQQAQQQIAKYCQ